MRFPADALVLSAFVACAGGGTGASADAPEQTPRPALGTTARAPPTPEEVQAAALKLRADPNLGGEQKIR